MAESTIEYDCTQAQLGSSMTQGLLELVAQVTSSMLED